MENSRSVLLGEPCSKAASFGRMCVSDHPHAMQPFIGRFLAGANVFFPQFPNRVAVYGQHVYVTERKGCRVQVFDKSGALLVFRCLRLVPWPFIHGIAPCIVWWRREVHQGLGVARKRTAVLRQPSWRRGHSWTRLWCVPATPQNVSASLLTGYRLSFLSFVHAFTCFCVLFWRCWVCLVVDSYNHCIKAYSI